MMEILNETGFYVEYATYIFSILPIPIFFFRSLPVKLGLVKHSKNADKYKNEHSQRMGMTGKLLGKTWNMELKRIKNKKKMSFGSSCLIVAHKRDDWGK